MAKRRNMGGRPAKAGASVTPMRLSKEDRAIAKTIGSGNMTAGVEKALKFYTIYHDSDSDLINQAKRAIANGSDPKDAWYIITQVWLLSDDADYAEGLELWEKLKPHILKTIESVLQNTIHNSNA